MFNVVWSFFQSFPPRSLLAFLRFQDGLGSAFTAAPSQPGQPGELCRRLAKRPAAQAVQAHRSKRRCRSAMVKVKGGWTHNCSDSGLTIPIKYNFVARCFLKPEMWLNLVGSPLIWLVAIKIQRRLVEIKFLREVLCEFVRNFTR